MSISRIFNVARPLAAAALFGLPLLATGAMAQTQAAPAAAPSAQQNRMATCNAEAKTQKLSGDPRKAFMADCLSGKTAQAQTPAPSPAPAQPAKPVAAAPVAPPPAAKPMAAAPAPAPAPTLAKPMPAAPAKPVAPASTAQAAGPVDLNHATSEQLDALWGVGKVRAAAIIAARPYSSVEDFHTKHVVPENVFERIKDQLVTH
jgi:DNA uptake protein ComE-like DNA-binding protein